MRVSGMSRIVEEMIQKTLRLISQVRLTFVATNTYFVTHKKGVTEEVTPFNHKLKLWCRRPDLPIC